MRLTLRTSRIMCSGKDALSRLVDQRYQDLIVSCEFSSAQVDAEIVSNAS